MNAVDTNVFVYAYDDREPNKRARALHLIDRLTDDPQESVTLWQVACEFVAVLSRWKSEGRVSADDFNLYCKEALGYFPLVCPAPGVIHQALQLSAQHSLSHWDSLLVAAALDARVEVLYTEDLQAGARYESMQVVNPFKDGTKP